MALSAELENRIAELRAGITAAPVADVANERSQLLEVLGAAEAIKGKSPDQDKAIAEVKANCASGASVVSNKRATLLVVFSCFDSKTVAKPEPSKE